MILDGHARLAGVLGWPVTHSRSPRLHGYWLETHGINGAYLPLGAAPEHFAGAVRALVRLGFAGANVTLPHKEAAFALTDARDGIAARIGAVNTLVFENGEIHGSNTDAFGFIENLTQGAPDAAWRERPCVVLGAGGAARAVLVALVDAGLPEIRLTNRSRDRAETLAAELAPRASVHDWAARSELLDGAGLVVNTTALGMEGQAPLDIALDALPRDAVVNDLVYAPLETALLAATRSRGNPVVDGLGMLLHQARPGFRLWFGVDPAVDEGLRRFVAADLIGDPRGTGA